MSADLERIKKLLRLGKDASATPAEAALALKRAAEIAHKAGLRVDDIDIDDAPSHVGHASCQCVAIGLAERLAANLVAHQFNVQPV